MNAGDRGLADELQLRADPRPRTPAISRALTRRVLLAMIKRRAAPPGFPPLTCCLAPPLGGENCEATIREPRRGRCGTWCLGGRQRPAHLEKQNIRMRILFWNTGKRPVVHLLRDASRLWDVDVLVLAELASPIADVVSTLNRDAEQAYFPAQERIAQRVARPLYMLTRLPESRVKAIRDSAGVTVKQVFPIIGPDFTIVAVHLSSKLFQHSEDQALRVVSITKDIEDIELQVGHRRTLVIGDFNMNPFERGLVSFNCFHAVMSRTTAQRRSRRVGDHERSFFYNPMWNIFGDSPPSPPGSYYRRGAGQTEYFWHLFDQVLLRPDLLDYFRDDDLAVLRQIGQHSLLNNNGIPDRTRGSDHLPLFIELSIEKGALNGHTKSVVQPEGRSAEDSDSHTDS